MADIVISTEPFISSTRVIACMKRVFALKEILFIQQRKYWFSGSCGESFAPCSLVIVTYILEMLYFRGAYCLHLHGSNGVHKHL